MIGGLQGANIRTVQSFQFPLAQPWALESAAQPNINETASRTAPAAVGYVREVDYNTCQIFQRAVDISYVKQSVIAAVSADPTTGLVNIDDKQPIANERDWQIAANMQQIAVDVEYTFINGAYAQATSAAVAARSRGIITGTSTNAVAAANAALSRDLINQILRTMAANGARFANSVIFVNALQKQKISEIFGYAPQDRNVGGVSINQIETDFALLGVVWAPKMPTTALLIADLSVCSPVFCPVVGRGVLFYEELGKTGATESGQIYGQIGLDYGPEEYHGKITGLAV